MTHSTPDLPLFRELSAHLAQWQDGRRSRCAGARVSGAAGAPDDLSAGARSELHRP